MHESCHYHCDVVLQPCRDAARGAGAGLYRCL